MTDSARSAQQETDIEFVERHWNNVLLDDGAFLMLDKTMNRPDDMSRPVGTFRVLCDHPTMRGARWIVSGNTNTPLERSHYLSEAEAWSAAAEYTRNRMEDIRLLREEIFEIKDDLTCYHPDEPLHAIYSRILARLQREMGTLQAGMKPAAPAQEQEGTK